MMTPLRKPHQPQRSCVVCRGKADKSSLVRLVISDGKLTTDPTQKLPGRGLYVHKHCDIAKISARSLRKNRG